MQVVVVLRRILAQFIVIDLIMVPYSGERYSFFF